MARLNLLGTGFGDHGLPVTPCEVVTGAMWLKARDTLHRIADMADELDVTFSLENLNAAVDHPGIPFARADMGHCGPVALEAWPPSTPEQALEVFRRAVTP